MYFDFKREKLKFYKRGENFCPAHFHHAVEILYVTENNKTVTINDIPHEMHENDVLVCAPWAIHSYMRCERGEQICAVIPCEFCLDFESLSSNYAPREIIIHDDDKSILRLMEFLENADNRILYEGIVNTILGLYVKKTKFVKETAPQLQAKMGEIANYIDEHYKEQISLKQIAQRFGYTQTHFSMLFKKLFSINFVNYLNFVRIQKSLPLLKTHLISSIYAYCGFTNPQQYFLYFKRFLNCSPLEYLSKGDEQLYF